MIHNTTQAVSAVSARHLSNAHSASAQAARTAHAVSNEKKVGPAVNAGAQTRLAGLPARSPKSAVYL